jgi:hypothetical protein
MLAQHGSEWAGAKLIPLKFSQPARSIFWPSQFFSSLRIFLCGRYLMA